MEQSLPEAVGVSTLELTQWLVREVVHCLHWATCADFSASRLSIVDSPRLDLCDVLFFLTHEKTLSQYALPFGTVRIPLITRESSLTCRSFKCCPMFCQCRSDARSHVSDLVKARLLRDHVHMPMGRRHGKCWMKNLGRLTLSLLNLFMRSLPRHFPPAGVSFGCIQSLCSHQNHLYYWQLQDLMHAYHKWAHVPFEHGSHVKIKTASKQEKQIMLVATVQPKRCHLHSLCNASIDV